MTVEARQGKASGGKRSNLYILVFGGLVHGPGDRCNNGQNWLFIWCFIGVKWGKI